VYRQEVGTGRRFRVTRTATGVSGITSLSPALTVARQSGRVLFSVFDRQGYNLVRLDGAQTQGTPIDESPAAVAASGPTGVPGAGTPGSAPGTTTTTASSSSSGNSGGNGGVLPPVGTARSSAIEEYLADASTGLVRRDTTFDRTGLRSRLGLNYVAPPQVGGGYNSTFGPQLVGGIAALFGDQLNNQQVVAVVQAQGQIQDIGGQVQYINTRSRWNWGGGAPTCRSRTSPPVTPTTRRAAAWRSTRTSSAVTFDQLQGLAQYPLTRRSGFEFAAGGVAAGRGGVQTFATLFDPNTGQAFAQRREGAAADRAAAQHVEATAAFVGTTRVFGLTSPIAGARYRFEVSPRAGDIKYTQVTGRLPRYLFLRR
jgi:hypothetical protein